MHNPASLGKIPATAALLLLCFFQGNWAAFGRAACPRAAVTGCAPTLTEPRTQPQGLPPFPALSVPLGGEGGAQHQPGREAESKGITPHITRGGGKPGSCWRPRGSYSSARRAALCSQTRSPLQGRGVSRPLTQHRAVCVRHRVGTAGAQSGLFLHQWWVVFFSQILLLHPPHAPVLLLGGELQPSPTVTCARASPQLPSPP